MRETIRCCISCILPCGALDVVRIVHVNGKVEEISHGVMACEVLRAHPKHVLKRPPSASEEYNGGGGCGGGRATIVPPNAELQKGKIYFLMPVAAPPEKAAAVGAAVKSSNRRRRKKVDGGGGVNDEGGEMKTRLLLDSERYLSEIMSEKVSTVRDRRRGRVAVWRPHLESISEASSDRCSTE